MYIDLMWDIKYCNNSIKLSNYPIRADHLLQSVKERVKCCEGECETVDCTVIDQYDGDTLSCPWGSLANGLGINPGESFASIFGMI